MSTWRQDFARLALELNDGEDCEEILALYAKVAAVVENLLDRLEHMSNEESRLQQEIGSVMAVNERQAALLRQAGREVQP